MRFKKDKKKVARFSFYIIIVASILGCSGGGKSKVKIKDLPQIETSETLATPKDAVPIVYRRHIYIPSEVDSILGNFAFDTGADGLYLDSTYYVNNSFREFEFINAKLPGVGSGSPQRVIVITDTVCFKFEDYINNLAFIPVLSLKPILGDFADGILGKQYFTNGVLEINYLHEFIRLHEDISAIDILDYTKISMKKEDNRLFVPATIQINDAVTIQDYFLLDIGSGGSVIITSATAEKYELSDRIVRKIPYYTKYGGVSGHSSSCTFRAYSIEIGDYRFDNVTMRYSEDKSGPLSRDNYAGLLGNEILECFDVIIDFVNDDLYLKPNQNYNKSFGFSKLGFGYVDRNATMNAWIVTGLYKGSNAETAGLKIDDKIISVNGIEVHEISFTEQSDYWRTTDEVSLTILRNNKEERIEFELQYVL